MVFFAIRLLGLMAAGCGLAVSNVRAASVPLVTLDGSVQPIAPASEATNPHKPFIKRTVLTAAELAAPFNFEVGLKMRDLAGLQARVSRGDRIPPQEMASKYQPTAADYGRVVAWLTGLGIQTTRTDDTHLAVFARATVARLQRALHLNFARVELEGKDYTSAVSDPKIPSDLTSVIVGINGLQPHLRAQKHSIASPSR